MNNWWNLSRWWAMIHWKASVKPTESEVAVIRRLLPEHDSRSAKLLQQVIDAPKIERRFLSPNSYILRIPYVKDDATLIDSADSWLSPTISLEDVTTRRKLRFTVKVLVGGYLNELIGVAEDGGPWPIDWRIDQSSLASARAAGGMNWLPSTISVQQRKEILERLANWCNVKPMNTGSIASLSVKPPKSSEAIAACERTLGHHYPTSVVEFLQIANGFSITKERGCHIFGTEDYYPLDWNGKTYLVVTSLDDDGVIAIDLDGDPMTAMVHFDGHSVHRLKSGSFREYVGKILERAGCRK